MRGWIATPSPTGTGAQRRRTRELFDIITPGGVHLAPDLAAPSDRLLRGPPPAFAVNTLVKKGLGRAGVDERLERLFERGIDPEDEGGREGSADRTPGPRARGVQRFADGCDALVLDAIGNCADRAAGPSAPPRGPGGARGPRARSDASGDDALHVASAPVRAQARARRILRPDSEGDSPAPSTVEVPAGRATLGARPGEIPFGWDNEFPARRVDVPAFEIDAHDVTNERFMDFVEAGGLRRPKLRGFGIEHPPVLGAARRSWKWTGCSRRSTCPPPGRCYVSHAEAEAYARWKGARLPTEAEYHRAASAIRRGRASASVGRRRTRPLARHLRLCVVEPVSRREPSRGTERVGRSRSRRERLGVDVHDVRAVSGFRPLPSYPEYSADFFDGRHLVMKGASPATDATLLRRSFRNWFRPN
jgi:formylglycine-generating enzyme required for sulfatase activity